MPTNYRRYSTVPVLCTLYGTVQVQEVTGTIRSVSAHSCNTINKCDCGLKFHTLKDQQRDGAMELPATQIILD